MRPFDAKLLKILKTETERERRFRTDPAARAQFIQGMEESALRPDLIEGPRRPVNVGRLLRYVDWVHHRKNFLEINYIVSGTMTVEVGERRILLETGDFFMSNRYSMVTRKALGENDIVVSFILQTQFLEEACTKLKVNNVLSEFMLDILRRDASWNRYLHFHNVDDIAVHNLAETMIYAAFPYLDDTIIQNGVEGDEEICKAIMTALFISLSKNLPALAPDSPTNFDEVIRQTVSNYIGNHYKTATLRELQEMVHQSESALSRQIKSIFGFTFKELLLQKRFERAVELLQQTDLSVSEIAAAVGYENTSFFYRRFREIYGISPKDYRNQEE